MKKIIQKILTCIRENASLKQASKQASKQARKKERKKGGNGLTHCFLKGVALC